MAAKKTTTKRPPRQVWIVVSEDGRPLAVETTKKAAADPRLLEPGQRAVGPYVLAERVRER